MSGQKLVHKVKSLKKKKKKTCVCSRGHIFSLIIMKLGQNDCLNEIKEELENGSKTRSDIRKTLCML